MIAFRHADPRYPFLWASGTQPAGRWHAMGEGPAHYFSDTPDGAWAEFLRHEEITEPEDLTGIRRALWAIDLGHEPPERPALPLAVSTGAPDTYGSCQSEARRLRAQGAAAMTAPSAALLPGAASGWRVDGGFRPGPARDGRVFVLYGSRPALVGWSATVAGRPGSELLPHVRHF